MRTKTLAILALVFGLAFAGVTDFTKLYALSTVLAIAAGACGFLAFVGCVGIGIAWANKRGVLDD